MRHAGRVTGTRGGAESAASGRRITVSVLRGAGFAGAFAAVYTLLIASVGGQSLDAGSFGAFSIVNEPFGSVVGSLRTGGVVVLALAASVVGVVALARRKWRSVVTAGIVVAVSFLGSEALKRILPRPDLGDHGYADNTFPSGHMAIALSLATAVAIMLTRARWARVVTFLALLIAGIVGCASFVSYAHRPSDVLGAEVVVGLVLSCVLWRRSSAGRRHPVLAAAAAVCVVAGAVAAAAGGLVAVADPTGQRLIVSGGWVLLTLASTALVIALAPDLTDPRTDPDPRSRQKPRPARPAAPGAVPPPD